MEKKKRKTLLIGAAALVLFGVSAAIFFLLDFTKTDENYLAFIFLLISEALFFGSLLAIQPGKLLRNVGLTAASAMYLLITVILTFVAAAFAIKMAILLLLEIIALGLTLVIAIATVFFGNTHGERE